MRFKGLQIMLLNSFVRNRGGFQLNTVSRLAHFYPAEANRVVWNTLYKVEESLFLFLINCNDKSWCLWDNGYVWHLKTAVIVSEIIKWVNLKKTPYIRIYVLIVMTEC